MSKSERSKSERSKSESVIQREIMLAASEAGITVWRNNVGTAWQGKKTTADGATVQLRNSFQFEVGRAILLQEPRRIEFGLCPGSSDLIGLRSVVIGPEHVGSTLAQFVALEIKTRTGKTGQKQRHFLEFVANAGGFARLARNVGDLGLTMSAISD